MPKVIPITAARRRRAHDKAAFKQLLGEYEREFQPKTAHEGFLIREMALARWRLQRAQAIASAVPEHINFIDRYVASIERSYHRAHRELVQCRKKSR